MTTPTHNIIFVIGGPGAGKGTVCAKLAEAHGYKHFSAGDLLRAEAKSGTDRGAEIAKLQAEGKLVPSEITVELLQKAVKGAAGAPGYLIDGFPRNVYQADLFETGFQRASAILNLDAAEDVMTARILSRAKTSGRSDDNLAALKKRFATHRENSGPVLAKYEAEGRVLSVDANGTVDEVLQRAETALQLGTAE